MYMIKHILYKTILPALFLTGFFNAAYCAAPCSNFDLSITKITFTAITSDLYTYTYEIKNTGSVSASVSELALQNYVSTDAQGSAQKAAGGSVIDQSNTTVIAPGGTFTGSMSAYPDCCGGTGATAYPYLLVTVSSYPTTECNSANNRLAVYVEMPQTTTDPPVITSIQSSHAATANVLWNTDTKSFFVKDWSGTNSGALNYIVISSSGVQVATGKTTQEQSTPMQGLNPGMYILYLSDEERMYSKKIIY